MCVVKVLELTSRRLADLLRRLFYDTLPILCFAILWTTAWARSYEARAHTDINAASRAGNTIMGSLASPQGNNDAAPAASPPVADHSTDQATIADE